MTVHELHHLEKVSARSYNVCKENGLRDIQSIVNYFQQHSTFDNLKNCGRKSNEELVKLSLQHIENFSLGVEEVIKEHPLVETIGNFNKNQREIVNSFIEINLYNLSNRSQNAIRILLEGNLKIRNFSERIFISEFKTSSIKNVGNKSVAEIDDFIKVVIEFIEEIKLIESEKALIAFKNKFLIQKTYSLSEVPSNILESQSIFKWMDYLIGQNVIYENQQNNVFKMALRIYQNQPEVSLENIAEELQLSRERVRQIKNFCIEQLFEKLKFVKNLADDLLQKYNLDLNQDLVLIDQPTVRLINEINSTRFTKEFISYLTYTYWSDNLEILGEIEDILFPKYFNSRTRHNWANFYLINKSFVQEFDFKLFVEDLDKRLGERIDETYTFNFKSYLSRFLINSNYNLLDAIAPIAEKIIIDEFGLFLDIDDNITFSRTTLKQVHEYVIDILKRLGVPSKFEEIFKILSKDYPDVTKSESALRGSIQRSKDIIFFGRSSTFGLKIWENEREGIKGGTIKDIIFDYLESKEDPVHLVEIKNEVLRYRNDTNSKSIVTNLKLDPQKQYIFFNQNFIGLKSRKYASNLTKLPKFLGRDIVLYVKQNYKPTKNNTVSYFSNLLGISSTNTNYILEYLVEMEFIKIDDLNQLST